MKWLALANLAFSILAVLAPMAHLLELPNKLALDGELWLAVQQHLYRGWGPFLGGPAETGALATSVLIAFQHRSSRILWPMLVACTGYVGMLAVFFTLNSPANAAVASWTPATLPADWASYRLRWELGHAIAALFSVISLAAVVRASVWKQP